MGIRIGSIDVGSNAIRMTIAEIINKNEIELIHSYRVPIRLGQDSFAKGYIGDKALGELLKAFVTFQRLFIKHRVKFYKAVATSALREAKNTEELVDLVYSTSHIQLDIIPGKEEARLVHLGVSHVENISKKRALLIDIGGGSIEFVISSNGKLARFYSFNLGTVRLLHKIEKLKIKTHRAFELKKFLQSEVRKALKPIWRHRRFFDISDSKKILIGTGGNIKALSKLNRNLIKSSESNEISFFELELIEKILYGFSIPERIEKLGLRKDRADVIIPALTVVLEVMKIMDFKKIRTPDVGLKDSILIQIAQDHR